MAAEKALWHKVLHRLLEEAGRRVDIAVLTLSK